MGKFIKKRSKKAGLPPGTLVHIGEEKGERTKITVVEYDELNFHEGEPERFDECFLFKKNPTVTWVSIEGVHEVEVLEKLGNCFGLHPLVMEDILNTDQRPKIENYGEDLFVVLKILSYDEKRGEIGAEQVSLVLRANAVLSFTEKGKGLFAPIRDRLRSGKGRLRKMGADYLLYSLIDIIVDHYFAILEKLGEKIEDLEEELITNPSTPVLQRIQILKKEMIFLRKWVWPLREVINGLERGESSWIQEGTRFYLRDVYDHTVQVMDTVEIFRDMLSGMLDIYLSSLTFLAGVYGMNFKNMPELEWRWGYPLLWIIMAAIVVFMLTSFRRKKWL
jgi:magnesium transporter